MKKSIKKLIKNNNLELKADIKAVKKQYKKAIKALDNKYSKQIKNLKSKNEKISDVQGKAFFAGQDQALDKPDNKAIIVQEDLTEINTNVELDENYLDIPNNKNNLTVTEVKAKTKKKNVTAN